MKFLILITFFCITICGLSNAGTLFQPIEGTIANVAVEIAVDKLFHSQQYKSYLQDEHLYAAICSILVMVEAGEMGRDAMPKKELTPEQEVYRKELEKLKASLNLHSGKTWAYWRSVAGIAHLVELGELDAYPEYTYKLMAEEMLTAFKPLLIPDESKSVFGVLK